MKSAKKPRGRPKTRGLPVATQGQARERILRAAEKRYSLLGFGPGASIRDIAKDAEVDFALVAHYFKNKDGLKAAVIERQILSLAAPGAPPVEIGSEAVTILKNLLHTVFDAIDHLEFKYRIRLWAMAEGGAAARAVLNQGLVPMVHTVKSLLKKQLPGLSTAEIEARALVFGAICEEYAHLRWTYAGHLMLQSSHSRLLYEFRKIADGKILAALLLQD